MSLETRIEALEQYGWPKRIEVWRNSYDGLTVTCSDGRTLSAEDYAAYVKAGPRDLTVIHVVYDRRPAAGAFASAFNAIEKD